MVQPSLAEARVEHCRLHPRIGADKQDRIGFIGAGKRGVEEIACTPVLRVQLSAQLTAIAVRRAKPRPAAS